MNMRLPAYLQDEIHRDDQQIPMINVDLFVDFSEYEWMAEEELEDFDRQVEEEFWEEAFLEECLEEMLEEEESQWHYYPSTNAKTSEVKAHHSKLNPNAPEFIPMTSRKPKV